VIVIESIRFFRFRFRLTQTRRTKNTQNRVDHTYVVTNTDRVASSRIDQILSSDVTFTVVLHQAVLVQVSVGCLMRLDSFTQDLCQIDWSINRDRDRDHEEEKEEEAAKANPQRIYHDRYHMMSSGVRYPTQSKLQDA
jgi:hypothetical protein